MVVARYRRSVNPLVAESQGVALVWSTGEDSIRHPQSNHNAGCLAFGADGYLYIAQGDGGGGGDPENNAQNPNELLGKILRIDVNVPDSHPQGFVVPAGNAGLPRPEIWSLGWRNPWKFSFDAPARGGTGAMVVADVGQGAWEEIDYEPAGRGGRNYGWRVREGAHDYTGSTTQPLVDPIFDYDHVAGRSITGGYVYRGAAFPALRGRYFFGDYATRRVWSLNLRVNASTGEASPSTAADLVEHTAELGGTHRAWRDQRLRRGCGRRAVCRQPLRRHHPEDRRSGDRACRADQRPHHSLSGVRPGSDPRSDHERTGSNRGQTRSLTPV